MKLFNSNDPAALRIREAAGRDTLSHALLFTGGGDLLGAARYAAAAMECAGTGDRPCGVCPACRKVREDIHPDVITVRDPDHKSISVDVVRAVRSDAYIRPNEGRRKIYLFPDCALLTEQDQNVLLKVVEEGPPYSAFLFCAENAAQVLQTLRSRCVELRPGPVHRESVPPAELDPLLEALSRHKRGTIAETLIRMEKKKPSRESLAESLERWRTALAAALAQQYGKAPEEDCREAAGLLSRGLTKTQIIGTIELMEKYRRECGYNVVPGHVLGALAVELEGIF